MAPQRRNSELQNDNCLPQVRIVDRLRHAFFRGRCSRSADLRPSFADVGWPCAAPARPSCGSYCLLYGDGRRASLDGTCLTSSGAEAIGNTAGPVHFSFVRTVRLQRTSNVRLKPDATQKSKLA